MHFLLSDINQNVRVSVSKAFVLLKLIIITIRAGLKRSHNQENPTLKLHIVVNLNISKELRACMLLLMS